MSKQKNRTWEEKEVLIKSYISSGLTLSKWCKENSIPITTFNGWRKKYKNRQPFLYINQETEVQNISSTAEKTSRLFEGELQLEIKSIKIIITEESSMPLLEKVLKAVKNLDV
jgi:transposase-like protein